jgi:hypothetical protein
MVSAAAAANNSCATFDLTQPQHHKSVFEDGGLSFMDRILKRTYPHIQFERYADDAICHCKSAKEAQAYAARLPTALRPASWCCILRRQESSTARMRTGVGESATTS